MKDKNNKTLIEKFLQQSNYIEREYSEIALEDAKKAWEFAYKNKNKIDLDYILEIHRLLMKRLRPDIAGKWRDCDVWIGGHRKHFISETLLKEQLEKWLKLCDINKLKNKSDEKKWKEIKFWHVMAENVHAHEDGNGRTYRIIMNIHRLQAKLPIKIIHEGEEQMEYYKWFRLDEETFS